MKKMLGVFLVLFSISMIGDASEYPQGYLGESFAQAFMGVVVDARKIVPGQLLAGEFAKQQVYIYRRTTQDVENIKAAESSLFVDSLDEGFRENLQEVYSSSISLAWVTVLLNAQDVSGAVPYRSLDKEFFVVSATSPESGCVLQLLHPEKRDSHAVFRDPCTSVLFDAAGRALKGAPVAIIRNLFVVPHTVESEGVIRLGFPQSENFLTVTTEGVNHKRYETRTATQRLIRAAMFNDHAAVFEAIDEGADISQAKPFESSPLDAAIIGSSSDVVVALLEKGAQPTFKSYSIARSLGRSDIMELLSKQLEKSK